VTGHRSAEEIGHSEQGPRELPPLAEQHVAESPEVLDTVLDNGLRLMAVRRATVPIVELRMQIPFAGENPAHPARAELLAETILTGTGRRDRVAMDADLAMIGGELSTVVDPERLAIAGGSLAGGFPQLLDVLADSLTSAAYRESEVERERELMVERLALARSRPNVIAREALQRHRYGNHPFAREVPEAADVEQVTVGQVRELHDAAVLPRGSLLVVVGDIEPAAVLEQVRSAFSGWQSEASAKVLPELPEVHGGNLKVVHRANAVQSQIRLSAQGIVRTDPRYPALQLANLTYGGFFSSRLVENIREDKGYTYHARSSFEFTPFGATMLVETDVASEVTAPALLETRYELARLGLVPPTESEVETVRQYAIGALLTSTASQAGLASQLVAVGSVGLDAEYLRNHPGRLAAVTREQVAEAALEFFAPDRFTGVVVGDAEALAPGLRVVGGVDLS
jgi:predicted Zn-dependent peptidase